MNKNKRQLYAALILISVLTGSLSAFGGSGSNQKAKMILKECEFKGGFIVHIGCGRGDLTAALGTDDSYLVHGLDGKNKNIEQARKHIQSLGLYGKVSVDKLIGSRLPYIDNIANLVVSEKIGSVPFSEVMRVLCPGGTAYINTNGQWNKTIKKRPAEIDEWTHYLHDATGNAVAHDTVVGPPRRMQWMGSPRYARHHDRMSSVSAVVTTGNRLFYIFDEAPQASILVPPQWTLIARDAFNGTILWKRPLINWHTHLWPLKSGPAQLPRRLVAVGNRVYVTLSLDGPLTALDAATGQTTQTYEQTRGTEEIISADGILYLLVYKEAKKPEFADLKKINNAYGGQFWDEKPRQLIALHADTGKVLWSKQQRVLPVTLATNGKKVLFHDGEHIVCLAPNNGEELWRSATIARANIIMSFYAPILLIYKDIVLFSGGETAGSQTGSWYTSGKDTMTALSLKDGKVLWSAYHPPSGYRSPEDMFVVNDLVWTGETTSGRVKGVFTGREPHTGEVKVEFAPKLDTYWFHHRCYRGKATDNYLLMSRTGIEFIDFRKQQWIPNHWVRGACLYGIMPANGLIYAPQHPCACYLESKQYGFNALAPASAGPRFPEDIAAISRLQKGPAYDKDITGKTDPGDWPTYRHDAARSGYTNSNVSAKISPAWQTQIGDRMSSPVVADGKVFVAAVDTHTIHVFEAATGQPVWQYTAGGRIDLPPTIYQRRVLFGSRDGWVYCLRAEDGALAWRFRAAPMDERLPAFEQLESVWPVHGSVLIQDGVLYCSAGRSMFLDDGLRLLRLDPITGRSLSETVLDEKDQATGQDLQSYVSWLNMPMALPDILSSNGRLIYMRSQPFNLDGTRLPLEKFPMGDDVDRGAPPATQNPEHAHLFSPTGFLDDSWWHRTYWLYGSKFVSGWCGYYLAGKTAPSGRILVFDDTKVYGFGRKPQYYRWTTPIEHHLFAADKINPPENDADGDKNERSLISINNSDSLNPTGKPLTVEAWVKPERSGGVILARGGGIHGYSLFLQNGQPRFVVTLSGERCNVGSGDKIAGRWVHLAGVLTDEKEMCLYVNGKLAASKKLPGFIKNNPADAMDIGVDDNSCVGFYSPSFAYKGLIDEVRIYYRALSAQEIAAHASAQQKAPIDKDALVLWYTFDKGDASDSSGHGNNGKVIGVSAVDGKFGRALKFTGRAATPPPIFFEHHWSQDIPLFARAMVLAGKTLFIAGPADLIDEPQAFAKINDPKIRQKLTEQSDALKGKMGAMLLAISPADGQTLADYKLDGLPIFDGMIAAQNSLYISLADGRLLCMKPN